MSGHPPPTMSAHPPRLPCSARLHRLVRTSSHMLSRRFAKPHPLHPPPEAPQPYVPILPPYAPPASQHPTPDMRHLLRDPGTPAIDQRTLSWESTPDNDDPPAQLRDRPREIRVSRRWSRDVPRTPPPQRRQRSSLGFLSAWRVEEYDDPVKEQVPVQRPVVADNPDDHTPWQNAHVSRLNLNLRELVAGGQERTSSTSSDEDVSNTPWDTPSPAKTPAPQQELARNSSHLPDSPSPSNPPQSSRSPQSPASPHSQKLPRSPVSPTSPHPPHSSQSSRSPQSIGDKASETGDTVHFSSVSESSLPFEGDCKPAVFKVQPVTGAASHGKRVSTAGAPASAEELIRQSSKRTSPWEKIFDGVPRPCLRDKWSNAVIGATSRTVAPPNAKHVRTVLDGLREGGSPSDRNTPVGAVLSTVRSRIEAPHWTVRLKTALFCHTVFRAGNQKFVDYVARAHTDLFDPVSFVDGEAFATCEQSIAHRSFAKSYAGYLQKWLAMKATAKFPAGRTDSSSARRFKSASAGDLLSSLPKLLDTLDQVIPLELYPAIDESPLGDAAISLVLRDSRTLLSALDTGVKRLVQLFFGLPDQSAVRAMALYARFVRVVKEARPVLGRMRGEGSAWMHGPDISVGLVGRMQTYIESGCRYKEPPSIKLSPVRDGAKRKGEEVDAARRENENLDDYAKEAEIDHAEILEIDDTNEEQGDEAKPGQSDDASPQQNEEQLENEDVAQLVAAPFPLRSRYPSNERK